MRVDRACTHDQLVWRVPRQLVVRPDPNALHVAVFGCEL
jgi:hypothetical protein